MNNPKIVITSIVSALFFLVGVFIVLVSNHDTTLLIQETQEKDVQNEIAEIAEYDSLPGAGNNEKRDLIFQEGNMETSKGIDVWGEPLVVEPENDYGADIDGSNGNVYEYSISFKIFDRSNYGFLENIVCVAYEGNKFFQRRIVVNNKCIFDKLLFGSQYKIEIQDKEKFYKNYVIPLNIPFVGDGENKVFERSVYMEKNIINQKPASSEDTF